MGSEVGLVEGIVLGSFEGLLNGIFVGIVLGSFEGPLDGSLVGLEEGFVLSEGV